MGQTLDEFRAAAAECVEAARRTSDSMAAATFLSRAERWTKMANRHRNGSHVVRFQYGECSIKQTGVCVLLLICNSRAATVLCHLFDHDKAVMFATLVGGSSITLPR